MKRSKSFMIWVALTLAAVMLWAVPTLAQGRGSGQWGQGGQGWGCGQGQGQGQGAGYAACPNYSNYQNSQGNWGNKSQNNSRRRGLRGGGRTYQPTPQTTASPVSQ
jgi:hypothetical protein